MKKSRKLSKMNLRIIKIHIKLSRPHLQRLRKQRYKMSQLPSNKDPAKASNSIKGLRITRSAPYHKTREILSLIMQTTWSTINYKMCKWATIRHNIRTYTIIKRVTNISKIHPIFNLTTNTKITRTTGIRAIIFKIFNHISSSSSSRQAINKFKRINIHRISWNKATAKIKWTTVKDKLFKTSQTLETKTIEEEAATRGAERTQTPRGEEEISNNRQIIEKTTYCLLLRS